MQIHDRIAKDLNSILGKKFDKLTIANEQAVSTIDPTQGRIFTLDYTAAGKSHGSVTVNIVDPNSVVVYYNTDIAEDMRYDDKKDWYNFLKELRYFAKRNLMNFDVRNIGKQQLDKKDYAYIKTNDASYDSDEITMESKLHGSVKTSYQNFGEATLVIKHKKSVEEEKHGARTRQIHSMYIENSSKERTRIPFNYLAGARALAQHVNQGGSVEDEMGQHIIEMIQEVVDLKKFVKTFRRADNFASDDAYKIIEQARERAQGLGATLKTLAGPKGYGSYVEQYEPTEEFIEQADLDDIRAKLVRIEKDNIVDTVLPSLARGIKAMEIKENALTALANDDSAKLELLPNPEEDQDIKDYIEYVKALKKSGRKTSEDPMDGLVNRIILTLTKRGTDELHSALANLSIDRPADKVTAYKLAGKYLRGMIDYVSPKAKKAKKTEAEELESWANDLVEGTWAIPDTEQKIDALEELMKEELPVGADAENATSALYSLIGDDELFDDLDDLASKDPNADARPTIKEWIKANIGRYKGMPADLKERVMGMLDEGYSVLPNIDSDRYGERSGLEGPFRAKNGKVVYYDKAEGKYYDPDTDMFISNDEWDEMNEGLVNDVMKKGIDDLMKKEIRKMFNKSAGDEGAIEMIAKKLQIPADDVKRLLDEDARVLEMLKLAGIQSQQVDEYNSELSMMANSHDRVERTYGQVLQGVRGRGPAEPSEVGDYIPRGMTKDEILKLVDMLAQSSVYDKDDVEFMLKDLAPMMEQELSTMANSRDRVENAYAAIIKRGAEETEVGDYIGRGMTKDQILKLIDMLADKGYDKDFLLKDLAPMMEEVVDEAEVDESIQYMYSLKDKGMSIEEIAKELDMTPEEVRDAMSKTESTIEESHTDYDDSKKIADKDGVEIYAYDTDDEGSAIEVYVNGTEVATGYSDLLAGDMVIDGKSFSSKEDVIAHYKEVTDELGETAELEEMKQRLLKLAGMA